MAKFVKVVAEIHKSPKPGGQKKEFYAETQARKHMMDYLFVCETGGSPKPRLDESGKPLVLEIRREVFELDYEEEMNPRSRKGCMKYRGEELPAPKFFTGTVKRVGTGAAQNPICEFSLVPCAKPIPAAVDGLAKPVSAAVAD